MMSLTMERVWISILVERAQKKEKEWILAHSFARKRCSSSRMCVKSTPVETENPFTLIGGMLFFS
jgi:hypothetical protein